MVASGVLAGGTLLHQKYRLDREIGRGGMGSVWSATRVDLGTEVAVKVMHGGASLQTGAGERFVREARAAARLSSPHVVRVIDIGVDAALDCAFLVMELLVGETLAQRLKARGRLAPLAVAEIIAQVARALNQAHALGIVHRDLKPANIFLVRNEEQDLVKLLDFGIAKAEGGLEEALTQTGNVLGTPHYMSPEQLHSSKGIDHRADLWSLAVIACECLSGRRPFNADSLAQLAMKISLGRAELPSSVVPVPLGFDEWFARATRVEPAQRFQTAAELSKALFDVLAAGQRSGVSASALTALDATAAAGAVEALPTVATLSTTAHHSVALSPPLAAPARPPVFGRLGMVLLATTVGAAALVVTVTLLENRSLAEHGAPPADTDRAQTAVLSSQREPTPKTLRSNVVAEPDAGVSEPESASAGPVDRGVTAPKAAAGLPKAPTSWSRFQTLGTKLGHGPGTARASVKPAPPRPRANDKLDAYDWQ